MFGSPRVVGVLEMLRDTVNDDVTGPKHDWTDTFVALPCAPSEHLQHFMEATILLMTGQCLDVRVPEQLGEDKCV